MDLNIQRRQNLSNKYSFPNAIPVLRLVSTSASQLEDSAVSKILSHSEEAGYMVNEKHHLFSVCNSGQILPVLLSDSTHFT